MLLGTGHVLVIGARVLQRRADPADVFGLAALVAVLVSLPSDLMISPSPDLAVDFLTVEAAILVFRACGRVSGAKRQTLLTGAVVLASAAGAMKLTALPVTGMVLLVALLLRTSGRRLVAFGAVAILFVGPLLASNTVTSGCPLLPSGPCADVAWAMSSVELDVQQDEMLDFIRGESRAADRGAVDWLWKEWVTSGDVPTSTLALLGVVAAAFAGAWLLFRRRRWWSTGLFVSAAALVGTAILARRLPNVLFLVAMAVGLLAVWKARAPGPRVVALHGSRRVRVPHGGVAAAALRARLRRDVPRRRPRGRPRAPRHPGDAPIPSPAPAFRATARWRLAIAAGAAVLTLVTVVSVPGFGKGLVRDRDVEQLARPPRCSPRPSPGSGRKASTISPPS